MVQSNLFASPIHFWPFYGNADGAATINATLIQDRFNNPDYAYEFDGATSYIEYTDAPGLDLPGAMSIETWVYLDSTAGNTNHTILLKAESVSNVETPNTYSLGTEGNSSYRLCVGGQEIIFGSVELGQWTHLAVTFSHELQRAKCYVNGDLVENFPALLFDIDSSDYPLMVGSDAEYQSNWHGVIDDIRLFDYVISETEVDSLYGLMFGPHIKVVPEAELLFNDTYIGYPNTSSIQISNIGLGLDSLKITEQIYTGSVFVMDLSPYSLQSGESRSLPVMFDPGQPGYFSDMFQILSNDNLNPTYNLLLTGGAAYPPEISVLPEAIQDTLFTGGTSEYTISIDNSGGLGDLQWSIEVLNDLNADTIYFEKLEWTDWSLPESQDSISETVALSREIDYYGLLNAAVETEYDEHYSPLGTLWGMGRSMDVPFGDYRYWIHFVREPPRVVLDTVMSLRLTDSNQYYDLLFQTWRSPELGAGYSYYRIEAPNFITHLSERTGVVGPGSMIDIVLDVDAFKAHGSSYNSYIQITSNDIDEPVLQIPFGLEILEAPDILVEPEVIDFTHTFVGYPDTSVIKVSNVGYGPLNIQNIYSTQGLISISPISAVIPEDSSVSICFAYGSDAPDAFSGEVIFVSNDPDEGSLALPVEATAVYPPGLSITPESIESEIVAGDTFSVDLNINNIGSSDLAYETYPFSTVYDTMVSRSPVAHSYVGDGKYHRLLYTDADEDSVNIDLESLSFSISQDTVEFTLTSHYPFDAFWYMVMLIDYDRDSETGLNGSEGWIDGADYDIIINSQRAVLFEWRGTGFTMLQELQPPQWIYGDNKFSIVIPTSLIPNTDGWNIAVTTGVEAFDYADFLPDQNEPPLTIPMWQDEIGMSNTIGVVPEGGQEALDINIVPGPADSTSYTGRLVVLSNDPITPELAVPVNLDVTVAIDEQVETPKQFKLYQNYPNPFNPSTTISYAVPDRADINIEIFDILGRTVWSQQECLQSPGYYSTLWSGVNSNGKLVASGIYIISFSTPGFRAVQKAVLVR
ncbi:MAG: choice-of-anchor D domain-containing protein [FCB group bacterium]|nr:choice-of-anchor D domain-containing protein [FCB group bacterium]